MLKVAGGTSSLSSCLGTTLALSQFCRESQAWYVLKSWVLETGLAVSGSSLVIMLSRVRLLVSYRCVPYLLPTPSPLFCSAWKRVRWPLGGWAAHCSLDLWAACPFEGPELSNRPLLGLRAAAWTFKLLRVPCKPCLLQFGVVAGGAGPGARGLVHFLAGFAGSTGNPVQALLALPTRAKTPIFNGWIG